jgi:hypothetical protein
VAFSLIAISRRSRSAKYPGKTKPLKFWGLVFGQEANKIIRVTGFELKKTRTEGLMKIKRQFPGEKASRAKVEDGTGFNLMWRHIGVYQRTV